MRVVCWWIFYLYNTYIYMHIYASTPWEVFTWFALCFVVERSWWLNIVQNFTTRYFCFFTVVLSGNKTDYHCQAKVYYPAEFTLPDKTKLRVSVETPLNRYWGLWDFDDFIMTLKCKRWTMGCGDIRAQKYQNAIIGDNCFPLIFTAALFSYWEMYTWRALERIPVPSAVSLRDQ